MGPGRRGGDPAPRRPGQQTFPYQEGLRDLLDRLALLPHGHCEGRQAHRAAAEELQQRAEHRPVQPVQAPGVDLVHPECRGGDGAVDPAVRLDLGVVTDAAQQPVGDTGRTAGAAGDLGGAVGVYRDVEEAGRAVDDAFQFGGGVELHVAGEAEAVPQRGRQQSGPGGGADQGEGRQLQRDGRGAGALADDDVDPEVLHRHVEHLFCGP